MKQIKKVLFIILLLILSIYNVEAKDTSYSLNKYDDEVFKYIERSYDKDLKEDGYVLGGNYLKEVIEKDESNYNDYQVMLVKYDKNDKVIWKYSYGNTKEDYIDYLSYTYDNNGNIDGYLIVTKKTANVLEEPIGDSTGMLLKIDLEGKLVFEKEINEGCITKIIPTYEENIVNGYISIIATQTGSSLVKYNRDLEIIWKRDFNETTLNDLTLVKEDTKIIGYAIIQGNYLIEIDTNGYSDVLLEDISKYQTSYLSESNNGFILYGITDEVKLKKGDTSYFIINYVNNEVSWETIGSNPSLKEDKLVLLPIKKNNKITKYFLLYKNDKDKSYEVINIDLEGTIKKKIKKIKNEYYNFENFTSNGKTIYFIGQINCPEDDNCVYDNNSLYLVSDEDKVIEVQDKDSTGIIIVISIFLILTVGLIIIRKKKSKN